MNMNNGSSRFSFSNHSMTKLSQRIRRSSRKVRRSSSVLFRTAVSAFARSNGKEGAKVENLRGRSGAMFEAKADIGRPKGFNLFGRARLSDRGAYILIKGGNCFVYENERSTAPKYSIELARVKAVLIKKSKRADTLALQTTLGNNEFLLRLETKDDASITRKFKAASQKAAAFGREQIVKKELGHEGLTHKNTSVRFADYAAQRKVKDQPEKPFQNTLEYLPTYA